MNKLSSIFSSIIKYIFLIIVFIVLVINIFETSAVSYDMNEIVSYNFNYLWILIMPLVLGVFMFIHKNIDKISLFSIIVVGSIIYLGFAFYVVVNAGNFFSYDSGQCWEIGLKILNHEFDVFDKGSYIQMHPYQLGYILYNMFIVTIFKHAYFMYALNVVYILIIGYLGYKISKKIFNDEKIAKITLIIELLFLPLYFYFFFKYGTIPGLCCLMFSIYYFVCLYLDEINTKNIILMIIFSMLACALKQNYLIASIAMFITLFIKALNKDADFKRKISIIIPGIMLLVMSFSINKLITFYFEKMYDVEIGNGIPIVAWVAMGTDLDNNSSGPGRYDNSVCQDYFDCGQDTKILKDYEKTRIINNIQNSINNPIKAISFYIKKIASMWSDPMFQSLWSGPSNAGITKIDNSFLNSLYFGGTVEKIIALFCKCILVIIYACAFMFTKRHLRDNPISIFFILYFIGGFIFHLFSEGKSQYTFMYVYMLIPLVGIEIERFCALVESKIKQKIVRL